MIKNEQQYKITLKQIEKFEKALADIEKGKNLKPGLHPKLVQAQKDAIASEIKALRNSAEDFKFLKDTRKRVLALDSLYDLTRNLIRARIALGWTQKELATKLKMKPQQIQKYETNSYTTASFARIIQVADVMNISFTGSVRLPKRTKKTA